MEKILHRLTLAQKFRVHADAEVSTRLLSRRRFQQGQHDLFCGARKDGALHSDAVVRRLVLEHGANLAGNIADVTEIDGVGSEGSANGDEREVRKENGIPQVSGRAEPARKIPAQKVFQALFMNRRRACIDEGDLGWIDIHTHDVVAFLRKADARHQSDVAGADNGNLHAASCSC